MGRQRIRTGTKFLLDMDPRLHKYYQKRAEETGLAMNTLITKDLAFLHGEEAEELRLKEAIKPQEEQAPA
jgi:predicted HicB family RNase H-like nuclease